MKIKFQMTLSDKQMKTLFALLESSIGASGDDELKEQLAPISRKISNALLKRGIEHNYAGALSTTEEVKS